MAIYREPDGEWRNTDDEDEGSVGGSYGSEEEARNAGGGGGDGGSGELEPIVGTGAAIGAGALVAPPPAPLLGIGAGARITAPGLGDGVTRFDPGVTTRTPTVTTRFDPGVTTPAVSRTTPAPSGGGDGGAGPKRSLVTPDGKVIEVNEADLQQVQADLAALAAAIKAQQEFENRMKTEEGERAQQQVNISQMLAEADRVYKEALVAGQGADRAQRAAEASMLQNYRMQDMLLRQQAQSQQLALQQRAAQQQRRETRPFAPRPRVQYA